MPVLTAEPIFFTNVLAGSRILVNNVSRRCYINSFPVRDLLLYSTDFRCESSMPCCVGVGRWETGVRAVEGCPRQAGVWAGHVFCCCFYPPLTAFLTSFWQNGVGIEQIL